MNTSTTLPLFGEDTEQTETEIQPPVNLGMAAATARLVPYRDPLHDDEKGYSLTSTPGGDQRVLLVVDCPFCDHQHIHAAGLAAAPRVCPRTSRCVSRPTGTYYFPAVTQ